MRIYLQRTKDRQRFVEKVLGKLARNFEGKVLVKPNVVSFEPYPNISHIGLGKVPAQVAAKMMIALQNKNMRCHITLIN